MMGALLNTPIDVKNIGLLKLLYGFRQDLDVYCLISVNATLIEQRGSGKTFWRHVQQLAQESIVLKICKILEEEKNYPLNSIPGVFAHVLKESPRALDNPKIEEFIKKYKSPDPSLVASPNVRLETIINQFRDKYSAELERFNACRDKIAAHSEFGITINSLPSYDVMEALFSFGVDFYSLMSTAFVGVVPYNLQTSRPVKVGLTNIFSDVGLQNITTDMQSVLRTKNENTARHRFNFRSWTHFHELVA